MNRDDSDGGDEGLDLATLLTGIGHEVAHAAELLRRYEHAVLAHKTQPGSQIAAQPMPRPSGARELQLVDLVIQILEDIGPLSQSLAGHVPSEARVPAALVAQLRLDQLRACLGGAGPRKAPHSGGHIDVF